MAQQHGFEIVCEYIDRISGAKGRRPGLDEMMRDARRGQFDVVLVWASDRIARSVKHFLEVLDELNRLNIEFVSFREQIDTGGPLGRAAVVIIGAIAELERNLIIERVRAGMRRARLEGRHIGRKPLELDRSSILRDRELGQSLGQLAKNHSVSRTTIHGVLREQTAPKELPIFDEDLLKPVRCCPTPYPAMLTSSSMLFQKAPKNNPAKSHKINGRIYPIRPFQNLVNSVRNHRREAVGSAEWLELRSAGRSAGGLPRVPRNRPPQHGLQTSPTQRRRRTKMAIWGGPIIAPWPVHFVTLAVLQSTPQAVKNAKNIQRLPPASVAVRVWFGRHKEHITKCKC